MLSFPRLTPTRLRSPSGLAKGAKSGAPEDYVGTDNAAVGPADAIFEDLAEHLGSRFSTPGSHGLDRRGYGQPRVGERASAHERPGTGSLMGQTLASAYGGYFGAALGVAVLALLGVLFDDTLQRLNALKALLQPMIGATAALGVALLMPVAWGAAVIIRSASQAGGVVGARLAQKVSDRALRVGIVAYGVATAIWLFLR